MKAVLAHRHAAPLTTHMEGRTAFPSRPDPAVPRSESVVRAAAKFERGQRTLPGSGNQWLAVFESLASAAKKSPTDPK